MPSARIGEIAAGSSLTLHELTPIRASLEDAFMELTSDSVEYRSHGREPEASTRLDYLPLIAHLQRKDSL